MAASSPSPKKRKARFTFSEVHTLLDQVRKNRHIVVGKFNRGVPTEMKKRKWAAITACVNEIGECQREVIEVIKKWSDMKCDTKRKVAAIRAGAVPFRGSNSYLSRELSPIENIVHQILELDGKRGRLPTKERSIYAGTGVGEEEGVEGEEEEEDVMLGVPSSYIDISNHDETDVPSISLPAHPIGMPVPLSVPTSVPLPSSVSVPMSVPMLASVSMPPASSVHVDDRAISSPVHCARTRDFLGDTSQPHFEVQYEIGSEDQELHLIDSEDEEYQQRAPPPVLPPPDPTDEELYLGSLQHATPTPPATPSHPTPPPSSSHWSQKHSYAHQAPSARDKIAHTTALSVREQHDTNVLLETVSRSLELLSESVQQLAEIQQEFVQDSLQLQRETVHILRDFASGALALMHDKLNGRPAL